MAPAVYRYQFDPTTPLDEVEHTILICLLAVQSLHGEATTLMTVGHHFDRGHRACVVDGRTVEGRDLAKLLTGFFAREFGPTAFSVQPAAPRSASATPECDPAEYRTLADWVMEQDLEPVHIDRILASRPEITLSTPLTAAEFEDLVGMVACASETKS
jgi:hypothetical protein